MSAYILFIAAVILILLVIFVLLLRRRAGTVRTVETTGESSNPIRDTPGGTLLRDYLRVAHSQGEETEVAYQASLKQLQNHPAEIVSEIGHAYSATPAKDYSLRWALVYCASKLAHEAALPFLLDVVHAPVPPEESKDIHLFSTVAEETSIRLRAIDGIERLAASGNAEARESLFNFLRLPLFSLRVAASQGLLGLSDGKSYRSRILKILGEDDFILDIKRVTTPEAATVGQSLDRLSPDQRRASRTPPPPLPGDGPTPTGTTSSQPKGPPVIGNQESKRR
jgi:hypothetical protein